jgi:hypothetical protein
MNQHLDDAKAAAERTMLAATTEEPTQLEPTLPEETLHAVIADQARSRSSGELWTSAVGGGVNALLVWTQFPSLHWLAAGFGGMAAYGAWGLLDRTIRIFKIKNTNDRPSLVLLKLLRAMAAGGGWIAALTAIATFLTAALGGLSKPGG